MPQYWTCKTKKCLRRKQIFTADKQELAICSECRRHLKPLGKKVPQEMTEMVREWADGTLARAWVRAMDDPKREKQFIQAIEIEIYRREGRVVNIWSWMENTYMTKPSGMGFEKGLYN